MTWRACTATEGGQPHIEDRRRGGGRAYPLHIIYASEPLGSKRFNPCRPGLDMRRLGPGGLVRLREGMDGGDPWASLNS